VKCVTPSVTGSALRTSPRPAVWASTASRCQGTGPGSASRSGTAPASDSRIRDAFSSIQRGPARPSPTDCLFRTPASSWGMRRPHGPVLELGAAIMPEKGRAQRGGPHEVEASGLCARAGGADGVPSCLRAWGSMDRAAAKDTKENLEPAIPECTDRMRKSLCPDG